MLNASDLWLRAGGPWRVSAKLMRGRPFWELRGAVKVSDVVEGDSAAVMRCLVAITETLQGDARLGRPLSDFSDVIQWDLTEGGECSLLRQW